MELAKLSIPQFRASSIPRVTPPAITNRRQEMSAQRSVKQVDPPGSTAGSEWIQYHVPDVRAQQFHSGGYLKGRRIDPNNNFIIQRRRRAYQQAKMEEPKNKSLITRDNVNRSNARFSWKNIRAIA